MVRPNSPSHRHPAQLFSESSELQLVLRTRSMFSYLYKGIIIRQFSHSFFIVLNANGTER